MEYYQKHNSSSWFFWSSWIYLRNRFEVGRSENSRARNDMGNSRLFYLNKMSEEYPPLTVKVNGGFFIFFD